MWNGSGIRLGWKIVSFLLKIRVICKKKKKEQHNNKCYFLFVLLFYHSFILLSRNWLKIMITYLFY